MGVKFSDVPKERLAGLPGNVAAFPPYPGRYVPVRLVEPLKLKKQGTKPGKLLPCRCGLPTLNEETMSLNHAFTRISEVYEPDRISHTGNVFERAYYKNGDHWIPLEKRRDALS